MPDLTQTPKKIHTINDIRLVPNGLFRDGRDNPYVNVQFVHSGQRFVGVPLIVGGDWRLPDAYSIAMLGLLANFKATPDEIAEFFSQDHDPTVLERLVYVAERDEYVEAAFAGEGRRPSYIRTEAGPDRLRDVRMVHPGLTIISGDHLTVRDARSHLAYADVVVLGAIGSSHMEETHGITLDHLGMVEAIDHTVAASFDCRTVGDVVKCLAIGADFVEIGPSMAGHSVQQVVEALAGAVRLVGADDPYGILHAVNLAAR